LFECIEPGDYTAREVCPEDWIPSSPLANDSRSSDIYQRPNLQ